MRVKKEEGVWVRWGGQTFAHYYPTPTAGVKSYCGRYGYTPYSTSPFKVWNTEMGGACKVCRDRLKNEGELARQKEEARRKREE